jgi:hypothetical protein
MTPDEAREHLKNPKTPDHIADEARAVLHPIVTAGAAQTEADRIWPFPPVKDEVTE